MLTEEEIAGPSETGSVTTPLALLVCPVLDRQQVRVVE